MKNKEIPWKKIYNYIIACGNANDLKSFSIEVLTGIKNLCQFDQLLVYFLVS